jgi:transcriptional regulator with XRE-family HTH domain
MISSDQIRAARALLNLSQKDLADRTGIPVNQLNEIETGSGRPRSDNLAALRKALEAGGAEFLEGNGVRRKGEALEVERVEGIDVLQRFYADILKVLPSGGEVLYIGVNNPRFAHYVEEKLKAYKAFEAEAIKRGIGERLLFLEGDTNFLSKRNGYSWVPRRLFGETPVTIYGDCVNIILWGPPSRMLIIRNKAVADTFRCQFEAVWELGKPVPDDVHEKYRVKDPEELKEQKG